jgi:predicted TPR repeat methyltransferase
MASLDALPSSDEDMTTSATTESHNVKTLDHDYVRGLFDGYSDRFEDELVSFSITKVMNGLQRR